MRVLLINPNIYPYAHSFVHKYTMIEEYFPLGLFSLFCALKRNAYEVKIFDARLYRSREKELAEIIKAFKPDVVGITNYLYSAVGSVMDTARLCKKIDSNIITVAGGMSPTYLCREILGFCPEIDVIVQGEGETAFIELLDSLHSRKDYTGIPGIVSRNDSSILSNGCGKNACADFSIDPHRLREAFLVPRGESLAAYAHPRVSVYIEATRGCSHDCTFCVIKSFWGKGIRYKPVASIVDEMEDFYKEIGVTIFRFACSDFTGNKAFASGLIEEIMKRGLHKKIKWGIPARCDTIDRPILKALKAANCLWVGFGVETPDQESLNDYNKGLSVSHIVDAYAVSREAGLKTKAYLFLNQYTMSPERGLAGEFRRVMDFLKKISPDILVYAPLILYPHTPLYEKYVSQDLVERYNMRILMEGALVPAKRVAEDAVLKTVKNVHVAFARRSGYHLGDLMQRVLSFNAPGIPHFMRKKRAIL